ncbi:SH3 domain-containing protein [Intestinibacter bartlettii DSM 16795]|uniref:C40 family peptidase n=2 Tax=Intestinibacter bartlettii TaxID=261299 RepID=UPI000163123A|nr:C40 family peptidase [Intestinibacter bartlettii]EDQ95692.1 SH3 domain protein [Intestinibacter bartlettii DSM 16795]UWO80530.1 SH3 domain-containing protein [Intestinibacter bartlettii]SKA58864.1 SH3 domain-containing protein [Intestinibacter bartlettii DSM 16795]
MSINKKYIIASAMMASVALPLMNASHVDAATDMRTVTASSLNFRTGPSTSYSIINVLMNGQKVEYISTSGSWLKVKYNGVTGYVHGDYVTKGTTDNSTTGTTKYVSASVGLNVRSGAGTSYSKLGKLEYKEKVTVLSTSNGWSKINYNGKTGYVDSSYLKSTVPGSTNDNTNNETTGTTKYVNTTSGLNVRSGAGTSYSKLGKLEYKEKVTVLSTSNGWSKINYNGKTGYVDSSYLQNTVPGSNGNNANNNNNTVSTKANEVIAYAKTLLGKPYVWGAQGPNSFDCSGFTYYVFKNKAGIVLPRTSSAQSKYGTYVSKSNLKAGDLVFFDTNGANDGNVSHVGMYIGNGQMIHASYGQKKIVIANFNDSYYQKAYVNARRVL